MNQNEAWDVFIKSGKIQDYIQYKNYNFKGTEILINDYDANYQSVDNKRTDSGRE